MGEYVVLVGVAYSSGYWEEKSFLVYGENVSHAGDVALSYVDWENDHVWVISCKPWGER